MPFGIIAMQLRLKIHLMNTIFSLWLPLGFRPRALLGLVSHSLVYMQPFRTVLYVFIRPFSLASVTCED